MTKAMIPSLSDDEIGKNLATLVDAKAVFPTEVQATLISRHVGSLLRQAETEAKSVAKFLDHIKPWHSGDAAACVWDPLDKDTWTLNSLATYPEKEKNEWFLKTCFDLFLLPMIEAGEEKSPFLMEALSTMLACWESDITCAEVSDTTLTLMQVCVECWRTVQALIKCDFDHLDEDRLKEIERLYSLRASSGATVDVFVSIALADNTWYLSRINEVLKFKADLIQHRPAMHSDLEKVATMPGTFSKKVFEDLASMLPRLCLYQSSLPTTTTQPYEQDLLKKVLTIIPDGIRIVQGPYPSVLADLQKLVKEASLSFSLNSEIEAMVHEVGSLVALAATTSLADQVRNHCDAIVALPSEDVADSAELKNLVDFAKANPNLKFPEKLLPCITALLVHLLSSMPLQILKVVAGQSTPDYIIAMLAFVSGMPSTTLECEALRLWSTIFELQAKQLEYLKSGDSPEERAQHDQPEDGQPGLLAELRRLLAGALQAFGEAQFKQANALKTVYGDVIDSSTALVTEAAEHFVAVGTKALEDALVKLRPLAGGVAGGASWLDGISDKSTFEALTQAAEEAAKKLPIETLQDAFVAARKVV